MFGQFRNRKGILWPAAMLAAVLMLTGCTAASFDRPVSQAGGSGAATRDEADLAEAGLSGKIYLYGETHGEEKIMDREAELWYGYYHNENMRHLFMEYPYYTGQFLNLWMESDSDEILDAVCGDWKGTAGDNPYIKEFFRRIKQECPETVFHGTDVGHQYDSTGARYLKYLEENGLEDSPQYGRTLEAVEQGRHFYEKQDFAYRENKMAENFIRAFGELGGESVMGIYGGAHVGIKAMDYRTGSVPSMANQLYQVYGDALSAEDISWILKEGVEPERTDLLTVSGKEYEASYYGKEDLTGFQDYACREFWRLENAYDDFKDRSRTGDWLPYDNYPMLIQTGQVFVIDYTRTDGSVTRTYYRSDGNEFEGYPATEEFRVK